MSEELEIQKSKCVEWFRELRNRICQKFETIENELTGQCTEMEPGKFQRTSWQREEGGGGEMSIMRGRVFEKVGVNISTVHGEFSESFRKEIPGAAEDPRFYATGISLVAHPMNPFVPTVHMNTRFICTTKSWFGGGADLTPAFPFQKDSEDFHNSFKKVCGLFDSSYYEKFSKWCDEYFFIKHRNEPRGVGGIFYDYLEGDFDQNFMFTQSVGTAFMLIYPAILRRHFNKPWSAADKQKQLQKRARYVEFNLVYDRGTRFGLMTGGNIEAILMSMPPEASWP